MFGQLGKIAFKLLPSFEEITESQKYNYAEHQVIEGKPKLQYVGDSLEEMNIKISFHSSFCTPETQLATLKTLAESHKAIPFILGSGRYLGRYFIEEISSTHRQSNAFGFLISIETNIKLKKSENKLKDEIASKTGFKLRA